MASSLIYKKYYDEILRQMIAIKSAINLKMKREIEKVE